MKRYLLLLLLVPLVAQARHRVLAPAYKSLQVVVNDDWTALPVVQLGSDDVLTIGFDELSHDYRRLTYRLEACNPDWTPNDELFESDWLDGFNGMPIDDCEQSLNTTVLYTHYTLSLPNEDTRLRMSGNYRLWVSDEDAGGADVLCVEFRVVEPLMAVGMTVGTNTDVDLNQSHQQVAMTVAFNALRVTDWESQVQTFVMQNGREDNLKANVRPNYITTKGLEWSHNRGLIFDAGNEYHKFEVLDPSHPTMGLAHVAWDEASRSFHAFPFFVEPARNYVYDVDADGAFVVRNSDNVEVDFTSDYVYVHYKLKALRQYADGRVFIDGRWTTEAPGAYTMQWDDEDQSYNAVVMQKLGYYNYQLRLADLDGTTHQLPEEGSFYQTENRYEALVYYRGVGERSWRLVGYSEALFRQG